MKKKWLDLVLRLTNQIYVAKKHIIGESGLSAVKNIVVLVVLEVVLAIVSLPLYIGLKSYKVTAFMEKKGGYSKITFDYGFRRILTLTGIAVILILWLIKLLFIVLVPTVYSPVNLYDFSDLRPADILTEEFIAEEAGVQSAKVDETLKVPELLGVNKINEGDFVFYGTGEPLSTVVLFLSAEQTAIYSTEVNKDGNWQIDHLQRNFKLAEGNHSLLVFSYDKENGTKSNVSAEQYFKVTSEWMDSLRKNIDVISNWLIIIIILFGIFIIVLTV